MPSLIRLSNVASIAVRTIVLTYTLNTNIKEIGLMEYNQSHIQERKMKSSVPGWIAVT